uniref:Uncharacterized protein n=1 Tax=Arundo donax TaxID=35708 RepID=A0A0A9D2C4_ARUDO
MKSLVFTVLAYSTSFSLDHSRAEVVSSPPCLPGGGEPHEGKSLVETGVSWIPHEQHLLDLAGLRKRPRHVLLRRV